MKGFRLSGVLRARRAKEDAAKIAAARARGEADASATVVRTYEHELDEWNEPSVPTALAFSASLSARQATASALSAALDTDRLANDRVDLRLDELREAAARRKTMERLAQRHAEERRRAEERAEQDAVDDLTSAKHHRDRRRP